MHDAQASAPPRHLDLRGLKCPLPVLRARKALAGMDRGECLVLTCTDPMARIDIPHLLQQTGDRLEGIEEQDGALTFTIYRSAQT